MKPHVKAVRALGVLIYACRSARAKGFGSTVREAFEAWRSAYQASNEALRTSCFDLPPRTT